MKKKEFNFDVYKDANRIAEDIVNEILKGLQNPTYTISGEARAVYEELEMFQWFEDHPLGEDKNKSFYIRLISMQQYRHLLWRMNHKDSMKKKKLSKWEKVMGAI